jgi:hypothetical protein
VEVLLFYICATAIFLPFIRAATKKAFITCTIYAMLAQAISVVAYLAVLFVTSEVLWRPPGLLSRRPIFAILPFLFVFSLPVPVLSSHAAKHLLKIKESAAFKIVLKGNILIFIFLWLCLYFAPF